MSQRMNAALMQHAMMESLKRQNATVRSFLTGQRSAQGGGEQSIQMTETRIYVGLNDAETKEQLFETETYLGILKDICREHHAAFSVDVEEGGYYHEDGTYTEETSLVLVLIEAERELVESIARELRDRFHQESVLVTEEHVSGRFIGE